MWHLTTVSVTAENGRLVESYGIRCGTTEINDISLNKQDIQEFVRQLNRLEVSEKHAYEVVEDFLGR